MPCSATIRCEEFHCIGAIYKVMSTRVAKRTIVVTVRITEEDQAKFHQCAERIWPGAVLSESGIVLGLARLGCQTALEEKRKPAKRQK